MSGEKGHDSLFRYVFSQPERAAEHIREQLPAEIVSLVRWETLQVQPGTFVDTDLEALHTDILFRARLKRSGELYLHLLFEHQSTPDTMLPYRLLRYMVRIWQHWLNESDNALPLPFIVPLVLYNGERRWNVSPDFAGMFSERERGRFQTFLPNFSYVLQDLCRTQDADIRGEVLRRLTLLWMKRGREDGFWGQIPDHLSPLQQLRDGPGGLRDIEVLLRYLVMVNPREMPEDVRRLLTTQLAPETERWWMTWAEQLQNEAKEKGREEEREKSQAEQARLLAKIRQRTLAMLRLKFGTLPDDLVQRVEGASEEELDRIAERIPTAGSLGDLLG